MVRRCRICGGVLGAPYLDYGVQPLANHLLSYPGEKTNLYPLRLVFCDQCGLSQLDEVVSPAVLYRQDYPYYSGVADSWRVHCAGLAERLVGDGLVIDIGANDGTFLSMLRSSTQMSLLGVEPCARFALKGSNWAGIETVVDFWRAPVAHDIVRRFGRADYIVCQNVLAHVDRLDDFLAGVYWALNKQGQFIVEVPYARHVLEEAQFDVIYHEHLSYFLAGPLGRALAEQGLGVSQVEHLPVHGGSLRVWCRPDRGNSEEWQALLREEEVWGLYKPSFYSEFALRVAEARIDLLATLRRVGPVAGLCAAAKATMLTNYLGLTTKEVPYIVDETPAKQGKWVPGSQIPIVPKSRLEEEPYAHALVFAWNYLDEVKRRYPGMTYLVPVLRGEQVHAH